MRHLYHKLWLSQLPFLLDLIIYIYYYDIKQMCVSFECFGCFSRVFHDAIKIYVKNNNLLF